MMSRRFFVWCDLLAPKVSGRHNKCRGGRIATAFGAERGMREFFPMAIVAECLSCGKRFKADESKAGKRAKCSQCGAVFVIGRSAPAIAPARGATVEESLGQMAAAPSPATRRVAR